MRIRILLVVLAALAASCATSTSTSATTTPGQEPDRGTPLTAEWAAIVEGLDAPLSDTTATSCHRGEPSCLAVVVAEMEARLERVGCAHTAPFAFTYLEMTRGVANNVRNFEDPRLISVVDARFAQQYFDAFDNWQVGNHQDVPAAWQVAFATADRAESSAALDLVLGMNAHISRDLAYVVAVAVATEASGTEEPADYREVNTIIAEVKTPMLRAAADRFDPNLFLLDSNLGGQDAPDPVALIGQWRSFSFELGVALAQAGTTADQQGVIAEIERTAAAAASVLVASDAASVSSALTSTLAAETGNGAIGFLDPQARLEYCSR